uniref:Uncharacterized protein n=1 Tax=Nelumbo nucifera TaxID=4432 RepID=A0A822YN79_NELNU|nr:TPA_asm: hypothetical protein HUJ06_012808 [Nelumbo nucifera]
MEIENGILILSVFIVATKIVYFAEICFRSLGDLVKFWSSLNEPNTYALYAYLRGLYPPGHCSEIEVVKSSRRISIRTIRSLWGRDLKE